MSATRRSITILKHISMRKINKIELIGLCSKAKEFIWIGTDDYQAYRLGKELSGIGVKVEQKALLFSPVLARNYDKEDVAEKHPFTDGVTVCGAIKFTPIKTENKMKENEKNSHYIVKTNSGSREKIVANQVKTENGVIKFYRGSEMVAMFSPICVESIVKGQEVETR